MNNNLDSLSEQEINKFLKMTAHSPLEYEAFLRLSLEERRLQLSAIFSQLTNDTEDLENFDFLEEDNGADQDAIRYTEEDSHRIESYIEEHFGKSHHVLHEIISPDLQVDILLTKPTEGTPFYILTTLGMGAWKMNVPPELKEYTYSRCELMITLPKDWNLDNQGIQDEKNYWPIRLLKSVARLPFETDTFLDFGHTIDNEQVYDSSTLFTGSIVMAPFKKLAQPCILQNGEQLTILQLIPLYQQEMQLKINQGTEKLLERFDGSMTHIVKNSRKNYAL